MIPKNSQINFSCWTIMYQKTKIIDQLNFALREKLHLNRGHKTSFDQVLQFLKVNCANIILNFAQTSQWSEISRKALHEILNCTLTWIILPKVNNVCMTEILNELKGERAF